MNYKKAFICLEIDPDSEITDTILKRQYRRLALKYHPDKNKNNDSSDKFHMVKESYEYLMKFESYTDDDNDYFEESKATDGEKQSYKNLLFSFINNVVGEDNSNAIIKSILNKISSMCQDKALDTLGRLDKSTLFKVYEVALKYREAFHYETDFIDKIRDLILTKSSSDERILLNPTLDDLFSQNLYKLNNNNNVYYVPLWQNEVIFDSSGSDLYVICEPELPSHITIDERNNIHINVSYNISDIWENEFVDIMIGPKRIPIQINKLSLMKQQSIRYANIGIPVAKSKDVYDVSKLSDINVYIELHNA